MVVLACPGTYKDVYRSENVDIGREESKLGGIFLSKRRVSIRMNTVSSLAPFGKMLTLTRLSPFPPWHLVGFKERHSILEGGD